MTPAYEQPGSGPDLVLIPGTFVRLEVIEGAGHSVHLEAPMAFARLVTSFLAS